jgi:hypothetical protein
MKKLQLLIVLLIFAALFASCAHRTYRNSHRYHWHKRAHWHDGISHYY